MNKRVVAWKHENFKIIQKEETYPVMGEDTTIVVNVKVCEDCGEEVFDFNLDCYSMRICIISKNILSLYQIWLMWLL